MLKLILIKVCKVVTCARKRMLCSSAPHAKSRFTAHQPATNQIGLHTRKGSVTLLRLWIIMNFNNDKNYRTGLIN